MTKEEQKKVFASNLRYYISLTGLQQNEIASAIGIKRTTFNMWCNGNTLPSVNKIQTLADYFHISKSDLTDPKTLEPRNDMEKLSFSFGRILAEDDFKSEFIKALLKMEADDWKALERFMTYFNNKKGGE